MKTTSPAILTFSIVSILALAGCQRKPAAAPLELPSPVPPSAENAQPATKTVETDRLGAAVDAFEKDPSPANAAEAKQAFADLDGEIAELEERAAKTTGTDQAEATAKRNNLQAYRNRESARFTKAQVAAGVTGSPAVVPNSAVTASPTPDTRSGAQKVEDGAKKAGEKIKGAAEKTGETLEKGAEKAGDAIHDMTH